ncbi:MAG TPA: AI-2E family transporter [Jiangellales bacterium]|nr:AI-2E family transporter [Jiangellales bacterium]
MAESTRTRRMSRRVAAMRERLERRRAMLEAEAESELALLDEPAAEAEPVRVVVEQAPPSYHADRDHPVPWSMRAAADWSWRLLVVAVAVALIGWLALRLRLVVFPLAAALLLAALLTPAVNRLRRLGFGRGPAAATVFLGFVGGVVGVLYFVGGEIGQQLAEVGDQFTQGLQEVRAWMAGPPLNLTDAQYDEFLERITSTARENQEALTSGALSTATIAVELVTGLVLALFALIFFLYDGERIWAWVVRLLPRSAERTADRAGRLAWRTLTAYIRGTVLIALFDGFFIGVVLLVLGVPLAIPLGVLVFFGAFVPLVGAFVTGAIAVLVALVTNGLVTALLVLAGIILVQQLEGNVFQPFVLGRMVRIHPLGVVIAVTVGALTAGIIGAVVAVPIVAVANVVGNFLAHDHDRPNHAPAGQHPG